MHPRFPLTLAVAALAVACSSQNPTPPVQATKPGPASKAEPKPPPDATSDDGVAPAPAEPKPEPRQASLELTFVGDVIFGRYRDDGYDPIPEDGYDSFAEIAGLLQADVTVANLETPVIETVPDTSPIGAKFRFAASRDHVKMLANAGFDVVSLANNHYFDLREEGQRETPRILREEGIFAVGASRTEEPLFRVETLEVSGWRVGFIGLTTRRNAPQFDGAPLLPFSSLREMPPALTPIIEAARADHDLIAVLVHWGDEYAERPDVYTQKVARELVDAGADLVVGHHPHVLQAVEHHGNGVIAYSMGNFLFENTTEIPRLTGVLRLRYVFDADAGPKGEACLDQAVFHPAFIARQPQKHPAPATGYLARKIRERVIAQGAAMGTEWIPLEGPGASDTDGQAPEAEDPPLVMQGVGCD